MNKKVALIVGHKTHERNAKFFSKRTNISSSALLGKIPCSVGLKIVLPRFYLFFFIVRHTHAETARSESACIGFDGKNMFSPLLTSPVRGGNFFPPNGG